jgi:hypothetical protein
MIRISILLVKDYLPRESPRLVQPRSVIVKDFEVASKTISKDLRCQVYMHVSLSNIFIFDI